MRVGVAVRVLVACAAALTACGSASGAASTKPRAVSTSTSQNLVCTGTGRPTLVLEPGEGESASSMDAIRAAYDSELRVCGHNRTGAPTDVVEALDHDLAGSPGPYVLVGTSAGGLIVQAYAARHPDHVSGVVVMNPVPPWREWSSRGWAAMTSAERRDETAYYSGANAETLDYVALSRAATTPASVPFHVLISTVQQCEEPRDVCHRTYPAYAEIMRSLAQSWPEGRFTQVPASHEIYEDDLPDVERAIDDVLARSH